jgi:putative SOS response-associated peptidase YedK
METVATSGMFRQAFQRRRCLQVADGFYEWRKENGEKQPYFIRFPDDRTFGFAAIWERWKPDPDAEPIDTVCHVTTTPNKLMKPIHDRMPVILRPDDYDLWLDRDADPSKLKALLRPFPDGELETYPVSKIVNSPKNDGPENVMPV